jgi:S-adenosylmethionine uptake transporter
VSAAAATRRTTLLALVAAGAGIAVYALMDAIMKGLVLAMGAYTALVWRLAASFALLLVIYLLSRPAWPSRTLLVIHARRSAVVAVMAVAFFWGIARLPLGEAIALSFIAPLIALGLTAAFLKERVGGRAVLASLLGLAGVGVILAGRLGGSAGGEQAAWGAAAVLLSAVFYAVNLVMARHQAQLAKPLEIATFQYGLVMLFLAPAAPFLLELPAARHWPAITVSGVLAAGSLLLLSWAYARAEAQTLLSVEYTAFIWASLAGWWMFDEALTLATLAGTALIVGGCILAARVQPEPANPEASP